MSKRHGRKRIKLGKLRQGRMSRDFSFGLTRIVNAMKLELKLSDANTIKVKLTPGFETAVWP